MNRGFALILVIAGVILLMWGTSSADSISSLFSKLFNGAPTNKSIWLLIGGLIAFAAGFFSLLRTRNR